MAKRKKQTKKTQPGFDKVICPPDWFVEPEKQQTVEPGFWNGEVRNLIKVADIFFDVKIVSNVSKLLYGFAFLQVVALVVLGFKFKLFPDYFQMVVMFFIGVFCFYMMDIKISNITGIYWMPAILILFNFVARVWSLEFQEVTFRVIINNVILVTCMVLIHKLIKFISRRKGIIPYEQ